MFADILKLKPDKLDKTTIITLGFADESDFALMEESLNDVEREILWARYAEQLENLQREIRAGRRLHRELKSDQDWHIDYVRKPPSLEEFIDDSYWLGATLKPSQDSQGLFPTWKELLLRDFDLESTIHNLVISGSLGVGKTYVMVTVLLYRLVLTTLLKNPQVFFNLGAGSRIVYNILSVTKAQVRQTAFGDAMNFMARSGYFRDECNFDPDSKYSNNQIELPGGVCLTAGSKGWHVIGQNVLGVALDEGNWRNEADPDTKAYDLFNEVRVRIQNRFMQSAKFMPAISILASSAKDESSFTERIIKEIEVAKDPKHQLVYRNSVYKIKRHTLKLTGKWFKVCYGLKTQEPYILTGEYTEHGTPLPGGDPHEVAPSGASTELVPVEYLTEFRRRTRTALQSISGISTGGSNRFFSTTVDVERCVELAQADGVVDPCFAGTKFLSISSEDSKNVWDYLDHKKFLSLVQSRIVPKRHPSMARYAHIDLATTTMAGVAICHLVGQRLVDGLIKDGQPFSEYRLIVEYDFILTITAGRTKPINLEKIQNFFLWLVQKCNYRFGKVTADQFQSEMPLQMLESRGFMVDKLSVDRDKKVYSSWRQAFEEIRLRPYRQDQLLQETENLLDLEKKIDHPRDGSKDTCLSPDTDVQLLDGKTVKIGQLSKGDEFWVYGMSNGQVKAAKAVALGTTRVNTPVLRVLLDNKESITCTPDHKFMLRDGSFKEARELSPNDRLMKFSIPRENTENRALHRSVISVEEAGTMDVTCLRTDTGNFAVSAGVFVHNSDAAAGAYFNAISSDEKSTVNSDFGPSIHGNQSLEGPTIAERPPVEINLPLGYTKIRSF